MKKECGSLMGFSMAQGYISTATSSCLYRVLFLMQSGIPALKLDMGRAELTDDAQTECHNLFCLIHTNTLARCE